MGRFCLPSHPAPSWPSSDISCLIWRFCPDHSGIHKITRLSPSPLFLLFPILTNTGLNQSLRYKLPAPYPTLTFSLFAPCSPPPVSARHTAFDQVVSCTWLLFSHSWLKLLAFFKAHSNATSFAKPAAS